VGPTKQVRLLLRIIYTANFHKKHEESAPGRLFCTVELFFTLHSEAALAGMSASFNIDDLKDLNV
jgi:hypothetical protein